MTSSAIAALANACREAVAEDGSIASRSPEELLNIFYVLTWIAGALSAAGRIAPREHLAAIERIAPVLRLLRHADGGLARFHGGGRGVERREGDAGEVFDYSAGLLKDFGMGRGFKGERLEPRAK